MAGSTPAALNAAPLFPLFADLNGRAVLVVGGGAVAARKVEALLHAFLPFRFVDHTHATAALALAKAGEDDPALPLDPSLPLALAPVGLTGMYARRGEVQAVVLRRGGVGAPSQGLPGGA